MKHRQSFPFFAEFHFPFSTERKIAEWKENFWKENRVSLTRNKYGTENEHLSVYRSLIAAIYLKIVCCVGFLDSLGPKPLVLSG